LAEGTEEMRRQIEFLIKQINSTEEHEEPESDSEDGDEDEEVTDQSSLIQSNTFNSLLNSSKL